jgi:WD40 repeat protein
MMTCGSDGFIKCWDLGPPSDHRILEGIPYILGCLKILPNGKAFVSADYDDSGVTVGAYGSELFTLGWDKVIRQWRLPKGQVLNEFRIGVANAAGLKLSDDGQLLVAVDTDGCIWRWQLPSGTPLDLIHSRYGQASHPEHDHQDHTLLVPLMSELSNVQSKRRVIAFIDTRTWERKFMLDLGALS